MNKEIIKEFIGLINGITDKDDLIKEIILFIKRMAVADAIGIRLKDGADYTYYTTLGFSDHFIKAENYLCKTDECGNVIRDEHGEAILECMCGDIISKKYNVPKLYFTEHGSFKVDNPNEIKENTKASHCLIRGRCFKEGYKSVVIIPIPCGDKIIGLIQLNDKEPSKFHIDTVSSLEEIAKILGRALDGILKMENIQEELKKISKEKLKQVLINLHIFSNDILKKYEGMGNI